MQRVVSPGFVAHDELLLSKSMRAHFRSFPSLSLDRYSFILVEKHFPLYFYYIISRIRKSNRMDVTTGDINLESKQEIEDSS